MFYEQKQSLNRSFSNYVELNYKNWIQNNLSDIPIRYEGDMILNNVLSNLNNKVKYVINENNSSPIQISELDYLKLRNL